MAPVAAPSLGSTRADVTVYPRWVTPLRGKDTIGCVIRVASSALAAATGIALLVYGMWNAGVWVLALAAAMVAVVAVDALMSPGRIGLAGACATCLVCVATPLPEAVGATLLAYSSTYWVYRKRQVPVNFGTAWVAGAGVAVLALALNWPLTQWDFTLAQNWAWPTYWVWSGLSIAVWVTVIDSISRGQPGTAESEFLHPYSAVGPVGYRAVRVLAYATAGATLTAAVAQAQAFLGWSEGVALTALLAVLSIAVYTWVQSVAQSREADVAAESISQRQEWLTSLVERQDQDRQDMIARLHDEPLQDMVAAATILEMHELTSDTSLPVQARQLVIKAINEVRDVMTSTGDTPQVLVRLSSALSHLARSSGMEVVTSIDESAGDGLTPECARSMYLIAREALVNVRKHAEADEVSLSLTRAGRTLTLCVIDNGVGVHDGVLHGSSRPGHLGMVLMNARAALVGGKLEVHDRPGGGTVVKMVVEVPDANADENHGYQT